MIVASHGRRDFKVSRTFSERALSRAIAAISHSFPKWWEFVDSSLSIRPNSSLKSMGVDGDDLFRLVTMLEDFVLVG